MASAPRISPAQLKNCISLNVMRSADQGFGFSVAGGDDPGPGKPRVPILITKVRPGSSAEAAGVRIGSVLVGINGMSLINLPHTDAVAIIKAAPNSSTLQVLSKAGSQTSLSPGSAAAAGTKSDPNAPKTTSAPHTNIAADAYLPLRVQEQAHLVPVSEGYERVEALFPFRAKKDDEIDLDKADVVHVTRKGTDGWCFGENQRTKLSGLFPGNFVMRLRNAPRKESLYQSLTETETVPKEAAPTEPVYASLDGESALPTETPREAADGYGGPQGRGKRERKKERGIDR